ncbi:hypothetical protein [Pimelobacter simplex]|uniref:hypothetical protein n=1 Tax=Nocardioides simplex TaxID=2045 RepID=UPI001934804F|nr:hypothetical protein [Pimelobacter simplex]
MVVDGVVDESVAGAGLPAPLAALVAEHPVPATVRDPVLLLDVNLHQLARLADLVADRSRLTNVQPGPVEVREQRTR